MSFGHAIIELNNRTRNKTCSTHILLLSYYIACFKCDYLVEISRVSANMGATRLGVESPLLSFHEGLLSLLRAGTSDTKWVTPAGVKKATEKVKVDDEQYALTSMTVPNEIDFEKTIRACFYQKGYYNGVYTKLDGEDIKTITITYNGNDYRYTPTVLSNINGISDFDGYSNNVSFVINNPEHKIYNIRSAFVNVNNFNGTFVVVDEIDYVAKTIKPTKLVGGFGVATSATVGATCNRIGDYRNECLLAWVNYSSSYSFTFFDMTNMCSSDVDITTNKFDVDNGMSGTRNTNEYQLICLKDWWGFLQSTNSVCRIYMSRRKKVVTTKTYDYTYNIDSNAGQHKYDIIAATENRVFVRDAANYNLYKFEASSSSISVQSINLKFTSTKYPSVNIGPSNIFFFSKDKTTLYVPLYYNSSWIEKPAEIDVASFTVTFPDASTPAIDTANKYSSVTAATSTPIGLYKIVDNKVFYGPMIFDLSSKTFDFNGSRNNVSLEHQARCPWLVEDAFSSPSGSKRWIFNSEHFPTAVGAAYSSIDWGKDNFTGYITSTVLVDLYGCEVPNGLLGWYQKVRLLNNVMADENNEVHDDWYVFDVSGRNAAVAETRYLASINSFLKQPLLEEPKP